MLIISLPLAGFMFLSRKVKFYQSVYFIGTLVLVHLCYSAEINQATMECVRIHNNISWGIEFDYNCEKEDKQKSDADSSDPDKHMCFIMRWYCARRCTMSVYDRKCSVQSLFTLNLEEDDDGTPVTLDCVCSYRKYKKGCLSTYQILWSDVLTEFESNCSKQIQVTTEKLKVTTKKPKPKGTTKKPKLSKVTTKKPDTRNPADCFDTIQGKRFDVYRKENTLRLDSLEKCQKHCLTSIEKHGMRCKSLSFDRFNEECVLSSDTKETHPRSLYDDPAVVYSHLKELCIETSSLQLKLAPCFKNLKNGDTFPEYMSNTETHFLLENCQKSCILDSECKFIKFHPTSTQCYLYRGEQTSKNPRPVELAVVSKLVKRDCL